MTSENVVYAIIVHGIVKYVGATTKFQARKSKHKSRFMGKDTLAFHRWLALNYVWEDVVFAVLEKPKKDLRLRENYWWRKFKDMGTIHESCIAPICDREALRLHRLERIECPICGSFVCRKNMRAHQRTIKCRKVAEQNMSTTNKDELQGGESEEETNA